jgi:hypothetical protein
MKLPAFIEKQLVKIALSKGGPYLQKGVTLAAAFLLAKLAELVPGAAEIITPEVLTGVLWLVIDAVVQKLPAAVIKTYGKELQAVLNHKGASLNEDGFVGPKTVAAAEVMR